MALCVQVLIVEKDKQGTCCFELTTLLVCEDILARSIGFLVINHVLH